MPHAPNYFHNDKADVDGFARIRVAPEDVIVPPYLPDTPASRAELVEYYEAVARMDAGIGELIDILHEYDLYEDTLIIYLTDNGIAFPGAKTTLYQSGIRLPFIVKLPGRNAGGKVNDAMVSWVDIAPTLLDFAGVLDMAKTELARTHAEEHRQWDNVAMPAFHGRTLKPLLMSPDTPAPGWGEVYASHTFHEVTMYYPMRSIITRDYKLIWNIGHRLEYPVAADLWRSATWQYSLEVGGQMGLRSLEALQHRPEFELYDLRTDPWEANNLADDPAHAAKLAELQTKLRTFQQETADPWKLKWERE